MSRNWADVDVVMANPVGGVMRGWKQIRSVYERIFSGRTRVRVEFYDYTVHHAGDLFYAVGRERGQADIPSGNLDVQIRTTRVFRQLGGRWRQVHHHGSFDDPQQLAKYQSLV